VLAPESPGADSGSCRQLSGLLCGWAAAFPRKPYSSEDKRLLDSVASQAGIAIGKFRGRGEKMAERYGVNRRVPATWRFMRTINLSSILPPHADAQYTGTHPGSRCRRRLLMIFWTWARRLDCACGHIRQGHAAALMMGISRRIFAPVHGCARGSSQLLQSVNHLFFEIRRRQATHAVLCGLRDANHCLRTPIADTILPAAAPNGDIERLEPTQRSWTLHAMGLRSQKVLAWPGDVFGIYTDGVTKRRTRLARSSANHA